MRSLDYLFNNRIWNVNFNKGEVKKALSRYIDLDLSADQILDQVMPVVDTSHPSNLDYIKRDLKDIITCYQYDRKVFRDASEILRILNDSLQTVKRDVSNTLYFGLDKADYSESEIKALNEFQKAVNNFSERINLKNKFECLPTIDCKNCLSYGRNGCKVKNNEARARQWGLMTCRRLLF